MSSYVYMKVLEAAPERYDRGIRALSGGHIDALWAEVAGRVCAPGKRVLDLGCGTGGLTLACAGRGAALTGLDKDAGMLEVARRKAAEQVVAIPPRWIEAGVMELEDELDAGSFDAAVSSLLMSELLPEERAYVLRQLRSLVVPGGVVVLADEAAPEGAVRRVLWRLRRAPHELITWLLTQQSTRPMDGLGAELRAAGFVGVREERVPRGDFVIASAINPGGVR